MNNYVHVSTRSILCTRGILYPICGFTVYFTTEWLPKVVVGSWIWLSRQASKLHVVGWRRGAEKANCGE